MIIEQEHPSRSYRFEPGTKRKNWSAAVADKSCNLGVLVQQLKEGRFHDVILIIDAKGDVHTVVLLKITSRENDPS